VCALARERFARVQETEARQRDRERRELRFASGRQWDDALQVQRKQDTRPCLTMNRIPQFLHQVTNEQVLAPLAMRAQPVDDRADLETARIVLGMFRHIEQTSHAESAYRTAYEAAVGQGVGYFRIVTEYESPQSFKQVIKIRRIRNRFCCYLDPSHQELDGSDANWGFIVERLSRATFEERYGPAPGIRDHRGGLAASTTSDIWTGTGDTWITPDEVQVAEYFYRDWVREELVLLADGSPPRLARDTTAEDVILERRQTQIPVVWWTKINGYQVLERTRWLGSSIPIIPVYGEERDLDGEVERTGLVYGLMDPQMLLNYMKSAEAEAIGLAPRAPFVIAQGQLEGFEDYWRQANTRNFAFLPYKPLTSGGVAVPPPQRLAVEPAVQAITQAALGAVEDMKAAVGIYDASLGARGNETASVAIRDRERQGSLATAHYPANLRAAIRRAGLLCLELLPKIYDTAHVTRIIGEDGESEQVGINQPWRDKTGIERLYDVRVGQYDLVVSSGPSYATQRQEAAERINGLVSAYPPVMAVAGDYLVQNLDMPHSQEIAARLKTQVPPAALAATESGRPEDQVASLQAQVGQLTQAVQALNQYAQQAEGQVQMATTEVHRLTLLLTTKEDELRLKGRELDLKQREIDLKQQQMLLDHQIDAAKVGIDAYEAAQNGAITHAP
jgi:hypothetical protein